ncbi:MAG TPA: translocation/assembly module TamB domain-containing protein, partial [Magnetospirillum sp.]|nr:translocation/assembly module TamB domain-containing protein [Magnetospirillum sp.]
LAPSRLDGARSTLWLQGGVAPRLDLWARLALPQVSVLADDLAGEAQAFAHVTGRPATPRASGVARLDGVATAGIPPASGTVAFDLPDPVRPRGHLSGAFDIAGTPLSASTRLDRGAGIQLNDLRVESGQSLIAGDVEIAHGAKGRLTGSIPQLQQWERVVGFPLSGRVEADAVLDPARGQSVRLTLHGGEVVVAGFGLGNVEAVASGQAGRVTIETLDLSAEGTPVRLLDPALVSWRGNTVTLPPATVAVGSGQTIISAQLNGQQVTAQARLAALPLSIVHADTPGVVNGTVNADGPLAAPRIRFALTGHEIGLAGATQAGLGKLTARLDGSWSDRRLRGRAEVTDGASVRAEAEASLPLPGDGAIDGKVRARGDAGKLTDALPMAGHVFAGRLDAAATISGTMAAPRVNGRAELTNGRYENLDSGTVISPLHAVAVLDGDRIRLSADGNDTAKGTIRLQGGAGLDGAYGADIALDRFTALRRADVEGTTSGTLRLTGTGTDGRLEGRLAVPRAEVDVGHIRGGGPVSLEVIEINRPGASNDAKAKPDAPGQPPLELALAVAVEVEHAFVRGRGLDSEWQGQVNVGGTTAAPSLTGQLTAARGQLDALGKVFKLTPDSTVTFQGGDTIDPSLAVTAEASAADITAQVEVTGTAKAPEIAFTSTPPLPQDEVLARLLFGREAGKLSAFQQVQLAQMAASGLTGGGGG